MKTVSSDEIRKLDKAAIEESGVPGETLMERAGLRVAEVVRSILSMSEPGARTLVFAGYGNNGGDAFVVARHLKTYGLPVEVYIAGDQSTIKGDARRHLDLLTRTGIIPHELATESAVRSLVIEPLPWRGVIVDGILGTGIKGAPRGVAAEAISLINRLGLGNRVVAIDIPSGLDADTGVAAGEAVKADVTVTMGLPKRGLVLPSAIKYVGSVEVADIGLSAEHVSKIPSGIELITAQDLRKIMPVRARNSHKGTYGHVLIIGGAAGYMGAVAMAARACLHSGVGLVSVLVPSCIAGVVSGLVPEAMVHAGTETASGSLSTDCLKKWNRGFDDYNVVLVGPGMTIHDHSVRLVQMLITAIRGVLVLDADAINSLSTDPGSPRKAAGPVILTPHPGEMGTLLGCSADDVQKARFEMTAKAADLTRGVVVLKGAGTVVTASGRSLYVNLTGNPGMATGGMGDVLGGLVAGLAAQGLDPLDAACAGVFLHGRAGDAAAWRGSQASLSAVSVINEIPAAFREVSAR